MQAVHCHRHVCSHAGIIITIHSAWRKELYFKTDCGSKEHQEHAWNNPWGFGEKKFIFTMWNYMIMNVNNASSFLWISACIFCFFFQSLSLFSSASSHFPSSWLPLCLSIVFPPLSTFYPISHSFASSFSPFTMSTNVITFIFIFPYTLSQ